MLAFFVDSVTLGLPLALAWTALFAVVVRFDGGRGLRLFLILSGTGAAAAVAVSVLRQSTSWLNRELLVIVLLPIALLLGLAVLAWLWWPRPAGREPARWGRPLLALLAGLVLVLDLPDLLLLSVGFVEPGTSPFTSALVLNVGGYVLGVGLAVVIAWAASRASAGAALGWVRVATSLVLAILLLGQLTSLLRTLLVRQLVELPRWGFASVVWLLNNDWLFTALLGLAAVLPVGSAWRAHRRARAASGNPADGRLWRATALSRRRFLVMAAAGLGTAAVAMTVGRAIADAEPTLSPPEKFDSDARDVWVEVAAIDDGHLHRFAYPAKDGTEVRFIAIRKMANSFVAALDACNICGPAGYYEKDGQVICARCGVAMNIATIGFKGGCNPIPIDYTVTNGRLVVARTVLEASTKVFA